MCGIAGIFYLKPDSAAAPANPQKVLELLRHRGPDHQTCKQFKTATLYHSRLAIVDTSAASNQPFTGNRAGEGMVFNGEIFNYKTLQQQAGHLKTTGDVEVLFDLVRSERKNCLNRLNGFFAFAYYHEAENYLLLARDRLGIKPLYYFKDEHRLVFASELKPLMALAGAQELNQDQIYTYFRLNYAAGHESIFKNVYKLMPGQCIEVLNGEVTISNWYTAPKAEVKQDLAALLEDAVKLRLQADVPVGTFLSGGVDSSIISALAKKHKPGLKTFSLGFADEAYFDETRYSELVARHIGSEHNVFKLKEDDFLDHIDAFLAAVDEPFADSSAFNFYMLSRYTRQHVKVALSGDGADELFKGYNKHRALLLSDSASHKMVAKLSGLILPFQKSSRHGALQNKLRQLKKFNTLGSLTAVEKQKFLAAISSDEECRQLLKQKNDSTYFNALFKVNTAFKNFPLEDAFDLQTVLADDMLVKADRSSMQHGIEIRNPFLDFRVVELALNLSSAQKINRSGQKIILRNSFSHLLPAEIFTRSKKGFELPLQKWLSGQLKTKLETSWLNPEKLLAENLVNPSAVEALKQTLFSGNPGDSAARLWALIVFESWLQNFKDYIKH